MRIVNICGTMGHAKLDIIGEEEYVEKAEIWNNSVDKHIGDRFLPAYGKDKIPYSVTDKYITTLGLNVSTPQTYFNCYVNIDEGDIEEALNVRKFDFYEYNNKHYNRGEIIDILLNMKKGV